MRILHLNLKPIGDDYAEFRYFWKNPNEYKRRQLALSDIADLIQRAEERYYTTLPDDYARMGLALYNWLDGTDRLLKSALNQHRRDGIVLAIARSLSSCFTPTAKEALPTATTRCCGAPWWRGSVRLSCPRFKPRLNGCRPIRLDASGDRPANPAPPSTPAAGESASRPSARRG